MTQRRYTPSHVVSTAPNGPPPDGEYTAVPREAYALRSLPMGLHARSPRSERRVGVGAGGQTTEAGQVAVWLVILLPVLLALVGLVFDGGMLYAQYRRGRWAADGAAVAAANSIDPTLYAHTGQVKLDSGLAYGTARKYALDNDPALNLRSVTIAGNTVQVRGTLTIRPSFLSLFGVGPVTLEISGQERPAWGITQAGQ